MITPKFKLRRKPVKPKRKTIRSEINFTDGDTLTEVMKQIPAFVDYDNFKFEVDNTCYGCYDNDKCNCSRMYLVYIRLQDDAEYQEDLSRYESRLADYEQWLADNKETVENYIKEKTLRKRNKEVEGIARQLEKNRKNLEKLQSQYEKALKTKRT